jgi:hypothetical protein
MNYIVNFHQVLIFPKKYHIGALNALNIYFESTYTNLKELIIGEGLLIMYSSDVIVTEDETLVCHMWYDRKYPENYVKLLKCIAPFVGDTEITVHSQDGQSWQWVIQGGRFKRRILEYITDVEDEY